MEVKPIIVDDDHRRGWPEADPAVAQEPNATKHSLPLSLSFPSLHPPPPLSISVFFGSSCKSDRRTYYAVYVHVIIPSMPRIFKSLEPRARDTLWIDWEIFPVIEVLADVVPRASPTPLISTILASSRVVTCRILHLAHYACHIYDFNILLAYNRTIDSVTSNQMEQ